MDAVFGSEFFNGENAIINLNILDSRERMLSGDLIFDGRIGIHINKNTTISFIVDNILNREYQNRPADLGAPRTFTFKLNSRI